MLCYSYKLTIKQKRKQKLKMRTTLLTPLCLLMAYFCAQQTPHLGLTEAQTGTAATADVFLCANVSHLHVHSSFTGQPRASSSGGGWRMRPLIYRASISQWGRNSRCASSFCSYFFSMLENVEHNIKVNFKYCVSGTETTATTVCQETLYYTLSNLILNLPLRDGRRSWAHWANTGCQWKPFQM